MLPKYGCPATYSSRLSKPSVTFVHVAVAVGHDDRGDDPAVVRELDFHAVGVGQGRERYLLRRRPHPRLAGDLAPAPACSPRVSRPARERAGRDRDGDEQGHNGERDERPRGSRQRAGEVRWHWLIGSSVLSGCKKVRQMLECTAGRARGALPAESRLLGVGVEVFCGHDGDAGVKQGALRHRGPGSGSRNDSLIESLPICTGRCTIVA